MARAAADSSVFFAIADPTRRAVLDLLRSGDRTAGDLFESVGDGAARMSQSAFSQHLAVLRSAGLVQAEKKGNFRMYRLNPQPLEAVVDWAAHYDRFWEERLGRLDEYIARRNNKAGGRTEQVRRSEP